MSFFDGLDAEKYDRQYTDRALLQRIARYFYPQRRRMVTVSIAILLSSAINASFPILSGRAVDFLTGGPSERLIYLLVFGVLAFGVLNWFLNWVRRRNTTRAIADVIMQLGVDAFHAAADHDLSFYAEFSSGKVVSRITSDTRDFGELVTITTDIISQLIEGIIIAIVVSIINFRLALYLYAMIPIVALMTFAYRRIARTVTRRGMQAMANVNSTIKETISGIAIAKNFRREAGIYDEFSQANRTSYRVNVWRGLALSVVYPTLNALAGIATGVLVYVGAIDVTRGLVTVGSWYLFLYSLDRFMWPVLNLSSYWTQIQSGLSAAERVFALIDADPGVVQTASQAVPPLKGAIEFDHLDFRYKTGEPVLTDFNLRIAPGENIALVGHTGAGKSSVARLIARFYEFQSGQLLVDGMDIRSFDLRLYRQQLGIVSQVPFLFSGSVLENIRYAAPGEPEADILRLARQIGDGEWLETLPDGLHTEVGERGARLSMGQRQLVSLMRVLVQRPAIFILDEATASIDPFTEWQIQQALNLILSRTTSLLIAHRLSTVKSADRILVMQAGRIIEEGSHASLLDQGGHYAELYNTYFRHQSLEYAEQRIGDR